MEKKQAMNSEESYADYIWREADEPKTECGHLEDGYDSTDEGLIYTRFTYCPKCGEKL